MSYLYESQNSIGIEYYNMKCWTYCNTTVPESNIPEEAFNMLPFYYTDLTVENK